MTDWLTDKPRKDFSARIRALREALALTQQALADRLGVSFATVNRWENGQVKPSHLSWNQLRRLQSRVAEPTPKYNAGPEPARRIDFTAPPQVVKVIAEGERLSFGHQMNGAFATEISSIDPLPHQRIAVYDYMLLQTRLRFLLADDAGAGKTIMTGLYTREMLTRRLLRRILIVCPAGLVGNWRRELATLFGLPFLIIDGSSARAGNPFVGDASDRLIVSIDTLASSRMFSRLQDPSVVPYDLVVFDEAHKLSADRGNDLRVRKTERYSLAEALAGVRGLEDRWKLLWSAHHLLLLTATPHMGKEYPFYALWRLLEPDVLSTMDAFREFPPEERKTRFIRRTKEEMRYLDGGLIYPKRTSDTLGYELNKGEVSEQALYDQTTEYLRVVYNKAKLLNREAARLAMSVFQRRLASSTYALLRSFERRIEKLQKFIDDIQDGKITQDQLATLQSRVAQQEDVLESKTADEEYIEDGREEGEVSQENLLEGVVAVSLAELQEEQTLVKGLAELARKVDALGMESKFDKLREVLTSSKFANEKFIIFTEHRDTLHFLVKRLNGMGYTGQIAQIHGGMDFEEREEEVERFREPHLVGGARFLICTDAAGEGINLQFCWIMINYDVPWNPARLEQRMGRIHRYLQKHDPVLIMNLVAPKTREGKVLKTLLDKLEKIRTDLGSDKVFDSIGRMFSGVSLKEYMERTVSEGADVVARELDGKLTKEQVEAIADRERKLYGGGGDVASQLPRLRESMEREVYRRLLPGYVRQYVEQAASLVDLEIDGDRGGLFEFRPRRLGALDAMLPSLELYADEGRAKLSVSRPSDSKVAVWLRPGEPVFEAFRTMVSERLAEVGRQGAVFVDPSAERPYLFHMALLTAVRRSDPELPELSKEDLLESRLVGVKQHDGAEVALCAVEHLLLLKGGQGIPSSAQRLAVAAEDLKGHAQAFLLDRVAREMAMERKRVLLESLPAREAFLNRGFDFQEAELAQRRSNYAEKVRKGSHKAAEALEEVRGQQKELAGRRERALAVLHREPELVGAGTVMFLAHALVVPSSDPEDIAAHEANVEEIAVRVAVAYEQAAGARVIDVHTARLARAADLTDHPGFDLLSIRPDGAKRSIEVKGRAGRGEVEVSDNEWGKACNLREEYWLYAVYDCATPSPSLVRVQDPFGSLIAKGKGSVLISRVSVLRAAEGRGG